MMLGSALSLTAEGKISLNNQYNDYYAIDVETGVSSNVYSYYISYLSDAFDDVPALKKLYGKMRFMTETTYNGIDDYEGSAGITLPGVGRFAPVDILMYSNTTRVEDTKHVMIHELGHALDGLFYDFTDKYLHEYSEFTSTFNSTKDLPSSSRPLSEYAYSDSDGFEFLSEAFTAYYRDVHGGYARSTLGAQATGLNAAFAKYLCIAENDFNTEANCP